MCLLNSVAFLWFSFLNEAVWFWNLVLNWFRNKNKRNATELSKHISSLKDTKTEFAVTWKVMARARPYSNVTKRCNLCITEKFYIMCKLGAGTLKKKKSMPEPSTYKRNVSKSVFHAPDERGPSGPFVFQLLYLALNFITACCDI